MARNYLLICKTCQVSLSMGKAYWLAEDGSPLDDVTFDGVFSMAERKWHKRDEFFGRVLEKFLILHRNHELIFVPEGVDEYLEDYIGYIQDVDSKEILNEKVEPEVDWWEELQMWRRKVGK